MKGLAGLAFHSAWHRRFVLSLVAASVALSAFLLLGLERLKQDLREQMADAVAGTDLVVGARGSGLPLVLATVFHVGDAPKPMGWRSAEALARLRGVAWTVPVAIGDSHRGFAVVGSTPAYFDHVKQADGQALAFAAGQPFREVFDAVAGAEVARRLGWRVGDAVVLSHGDGQLQANDHDDKPFRVAGVLRPTGTPVDRTLLVSLQGLRAVHLDWAAGAPLPGLQVSREAALQQDLTPRSVSAVLVGLQQRPRALRLQREIEALDGEPLTAVLPGVALSQLWQLTAGAERALQAAAALVALVSVAGLVAVVLTGLESRRRELALLRSVGARPLHLVALLLLEGTLVVAAGVAAGALLHAACAWAAADWLWRHWGVGLRPLAVNAAQALWLGGLLAAGMAASLLPAWRAYRLSLADGLSMS